MGNVIIDRAGYRLNVGIVLVNANNQVLWARRINNPEAWQFPQGGVHPHETLKEAMFRELYEELGLRVQDVSVIAKTRGWHSYRLPPHFRRRQREGQPYCIGQKQQWFLLKLTQGDDAIHLNATGHPEFDHWEWVDFWYPVDHVIVFKRHVYERVLREFWRVLEKNKSNP